MAKGPWIAVGAAVVAVPWFVLSRQRYTITSLTVAIPFNIGSIALEPSYKERQMAWRLYVQLRTRKAALPFDDKHDVIVEVYDSIYELFALIRSTLEEIPVRQVERSPKLADALLRVQSDGLRPHLTRWQAAFRRWWALADRDPENADKTPQEVQRLYPRYKELVEDLQTTNTHLSMLADELYLIAVPPQRRSFGRRHRGTKPQAPAGEPGPRSET